MSGDRTLTCPLCGGKFPERHSCPSGCPLARHCHTVCCPHCHYRFAIPSGFSRLLERLLGREAS
ncbi:MAG: hypothetical protein HRF46_04855 [Acidobacteriota bacterium]